jgi:hypothetical protein
MTVGDVVIAVAEIKVAQVEMLEAGLLVLDEPRSFRRRRRSMQKPRSRAS